jgi:DNA repair exonuclease SbcCD ATPase subunit
MCTTATIASQSIKGDKHLNTNPLPPPSQVNHGEAKFNQSEVQDWDEAEEEEAEADESELIRVQQEIERLRQEKESIIRRQEAAQRAIAQRQHINREHARLVELQYTIGILRQ